VELRGKIPPTSKNMRTPYRKYKALINARTKELRNNPTPTENVLWDHLRKRQFQGLKFLRQHPILHHQNNRVYFFIADFYCHEHQLIIEVDGDIHNKKEQMEHDQMRTETLEEMGYTVIRFPNSIVDNLLKGDSSIRCLPQT